MQEKEAAAVDAGKKKDLTAQERLEEAKKALQAQAVRIASLYTLTSVVPCAPVAPLVARTVIAILHFVLPVTRTQHNAGTATSTSIPSLYARQPDAHRRRSQKSRPSCR